jgi:c(7)-type cytochrome triheme protein
MRRLLSFVPAVVVLFSGLVLIGQEKKKAPDQMVYKAKTGDVTFDHEKHSKRVKEDCKVCHDKLWPQKKGNLNYKAGMHKPAEAKHISCGFCHHPGGGSFASTGNCNKCHVKGGAKKGD